MVEKIFYSKLMLYCAGTCCFTDAGCKFTFTLCFILLYFTLKGALTIILYIKNWLNSCIAGRARIIVTKTTQYCTIYLLVTHLSRSIKLLAPGLFHSLYMFTGFFFFFLVYGRWCNSTDVFSALISPVNHCSLDENHQFPHGQNKMNK